MFLIDFRTVADSFKMRNTLPVWAGGSYEKTRCRHQAAVDDDDKTKKPGVCYQDLSVRHFPCKDVGAGVLERAHIGWQWTSACYHSHQMCSMVRNVLLKT